MLSTRAEPKSIIKYYHIAFAPKRIRYTLTTRMSTTATCFCGAVQLAFSLDEDNLVGSVSHGSLSQLLAPI